MKVPSGGFSPDDNDGSDGDGGGATGGNTGGYVGGATSNDDGDDGTTAQDDSNPWGQGRAGGSYGTFNTPGVSGEGPTAKGNPDTDGVTSASNDGDENTTAVNDTTNDMASDNPWGQGRAGGVYGAPGGTVYATPGVEGTGPTYTGPGADDGIVTPDEGDAFFSGLTDGDAGTSGADSSATQPTNQGGTQTTPTILPVQWGGSGGGGGGGSNGQNGGGSILDNPLALAAIVGGGALALGYFS